MDSHLDPCPTCTLSLQGDDETVAKLAFAVTQLEVPTHIRLKLLTRIMADLRPSTLARLGSGLTRLSDALGSAFLLHAGKAVTAALVLALVFGGVWFNSRLDQISKDNQQLTGQIEAAREREADVIEMVNDYRYLTYETLRVSATPGKSVNMLSNMGWSSDAHGMLVI